MLGTYRLQSLSTILRLHSKIRIFAGAPDQSQAAREATPVMRLASAQKDPLALFRPEDGLIFLLRPNTSYDSNFLKEVLAKG